MSASERISGAAVYSDQVLAHFRAPRHAGELDPGPRVGTGRSGSRREGRVIRMQVALDEDGRIEQVAFKALGCPFTIATCSLAADQALGCSPEQLPGALEWARELALPAERRGVALAVEDALRRAIAAADQQSGG